jgi:hypothetical protein
VAVADDPPVAPFVVRPAAPPVPLDGLTVLLEHPKTNAIATSRWNAALVATLVVMVISSTRAICELRRPARYATGSIGRSLT